MVQSPNSQKPRREFRKLAGEHALPGRRCSAHFPLRSLLASTGAGTPGREAGRAGRQGPESGPTVRENTAWHHSGRRVETEASVKTEAGGGGARQRSRCCAEHSGSYSLAGRGGRRVRKLGSAVRPAERQGEGGGPWAGKVWTGTWTAALRGAGHGAGAWRSLWTGPGLSRAAQQSPRVATATEPGVPAPFPWWHRDLPRLPEASAARPGCYSM